MALNVNWNWRMPTVGDPNGPANANLAGLQQGTNAIAQGIQRAKERENQNMWKNREYEQKLAEFNYGKEKDQMANAMKNREYWEQKRINDAKIQDMKDAMEIKQRQQQFNEMAYNKLYGNTPQGQEMAALQQALGDGSKELQALMNDPAIKQYLQQQDEQNNAAAILYGLNPQLLNLR